MAYNAVAQTEHDVLSDTTGSNTSGSPQLKANSLSGLSLWISQVWEEADRYKQPETLNNQVRIISGR
jgi:hypothetical protein